MHKHTVGIPGQAHLEGPPHLDVTGDELRAVHSRRRPTVDGEGTLHMRHWHVRHSAGRSRHKGGAGHKHGRTAVLRVARWRGTALVRHLAGCQEVLAHSLRATSERLQAIVGSWDRSGLQVLPARSCPAAACGAAGGRLR